MELRGGGALGDFQAVLVVFSQPPSLLGTGQRGGQSDDPITQTLTLLPASAKCPVKLHETLVFSAARPRQSEFRFKE